MSGQPTARACSTSAAMPPPTGLTGRGMFPLDTAQPTLLWQEDHPAFYLSLSRTSSGRYLLLSSASEVTKEVLLMDLSSAAAAGHVPHRDDWLRLAPRTAGVQQQSVAHWQSWLFLLVISPATPNGELRVAPVSQPQQHTVRLWCMVCP